MDQCINSIEHSYYIKQVASVGSYLHVDQSKYFTLGLQLNANHISSASKGHYVTAIGKPIRVGKTTQLWEVRIIDRGEDITPKHGDIDPNTLQGKLVSTVQFIAAVMPLDKLSSRL